MTQIHPTDFQLEEFLIGKLSDGQQVEVEAHLTACVECVAKAASLTTNDTLVRLVGEAERISDTLNFPIGGSGETPSAFDGTIAWETAPAAVDSVIPMGLRDHPRYRLLRQIGAGGMGTVWLAEHSVLGRNVAIKVIRPEYMAKPGAVERFRRESRAVAKLQHANIVAAYDAEEAGGIHFLVMEYVEGVNLGDLIKTGGALPISDVIRAGFDTALGLAAAHSQGLIHRDIKPHNLIRTPAGRTKILDFGLATAEAGTGELTGENMVMGTPDYIAPEQAVDAHTADARSDVYSLGCALYAMLTGKVPFAVNGTLKKLDAHRTRTAIPILELRPEAPAALAEVVARMMAKRPDDRFQSALEVAEALTESKTAEPKPPKKSRRGWFLAAGLLFFAFGIAAAGLVIHRIKTDTGEYVVETVDDDVEIAVKQGGKLVTIFDPKSGQKLILKSGEYEFEINGKPTGWKLDIEKATLKRGDVIVAKIRKENPKPPETLTTIPPASVTIQTSQPVTLVERKSIRLGGNLHTLAFDSTGDRLAVNGDRAGLYRAATGESIKTFPIEAIRCVAVSPNGKRFAVYNDAKNVGNVLVMNAETGERIHSFGPFRNDSSWVVKFAPNGEELLIGQDEYLHRANLKTGTMELIITAPQWNEMRFAEFSPDGSRLLIPDTVIDTLGKREASIRILEYPTCKDAGRIALKSVPQNRINMVKWTRQGNGIACLIHTGELLGFDWPGCQQKFRVRAHEANGNLAVSPEGLSIASVSTDGWLRVWDTSTGAKLGESQLPGEKMWGVAITPDGKTIATGSTTGKITLWESRDDKTTVHFEETTSFPRHENGFVSDVKPTPDGKRIVSIDGSGEVFVREYPSGKLAYQYKVKSQPFTFLAISPDGKRLAVGDANSSAICDLKTGRQEVSFVEPTGRVRGIQFGADGKRLLVAGLQAVRLWDIATEKTIWKYTATLWFHRVIYAPDEKTCFACFGAINDAGAGGIVQIDTNTGKVLRTFHSPGGCVGNVDVSPDGSRILGVCKKAVLVWGVASGKEELQLVHPGDAIQSAAFSPNAKTIVTNGDFGGRNQSQGLGLWDAKTGKLLTEVHKGINIYQFSLTRDGTIISAPYWDGVVRVWKIAPR